MSSEKSPSKQPPPLFPNQKPLSQEPVTIDIVRPSPQRNPPLGDSMSTVVGGGSNLKQSEVEGTSQNGPQKTSLHVDNSNQKGKKTQSGIGDRPLLATMGKSEETTLESKNRFTKGTWKPMEDKQLISLVSNFGPQNWTRIAEFIPHRSGKQCRERWHNHLNPNINKQKWSLEEDKILIEAHKK